MFREDLGDADVDEIVDHLREVLREFVLRRVAEFIDQGVEFSEVLDSLVFVEHTLVDYHVREEGSLGHSSVEEEEQLCDPFVELLVVEETVHYFVQLLEEVVHHLVPEVDLPAHALPIDLLHLFQVLELVLLLRDEVEQLEYLALAEDQMALGLLYADLLLVGGLDAVVGEEEVDDADELELAGLLHHY